VVDELRKLFITIVCVTISIYLGILCMIYGWGIEPQSYFWIIGVGYAGRLILEIAIKLNKEN